MSTEKTREIILETMESMLELQLRSVRRLKKAPAYGESKTKHAPRKSKYLANLCEEILTSEQRPLHVDTLVELLDKRYHRSTDRDSLASALAKKARKGVQFQRVAPGTYSLRDNS